MVNLKKIFKQIDIYNNLNQLKFIFNRDNMQRYLQYYFLIANVGENEQRKRNR